MLRNLTKPSQLCLTFFIHLLSYLRRSRYSIHSAGLCALPLVLVLRFWRWSFMEFLLVSFTVTQTFDIQFWVPASMLSWFTSPTSLRNFISVLWWHSRWLGSSTWLVCGSSHRLDVVSVMLLFRLVWSVAPFSVWIVFKLLLKISTSISEESPWESVYLNRGWTKQQDHFTIHNT